MLDSHCTVHKQVEIYITSIICKQGQHICVIGKQGQHRCVIGKQGQHRCVFGKQGQHRCVITVTEHKYQFHASLLPLVI